VDLAAATRVIALKEAEHRPLMAARFPDWQDRVEYWHVHDLDAAGPDEALGDIERLVRQLIDELLVSERKQVNPIG
jgi:protein-tyrosine phosphatase